MRNHNRLDDFYAELCRIHKKHFPDWRFGQLMYNFLNWVASEKDRDPFFSEEDEMLGYIKEFTKTSPLTGGEE